MQQKSLKVLGAKTLGLLWWTYSLGMGGSFLDAGSTENHNGCFTQLFPKTTIPCNLLEEVPGTRLITSKQKCESSPLRKISKKRQEKMALLERGLRASKESFTPKSIKQLGRRVTTRYNHEKRASIPQSLPTQTHWFKAFPAVAVWRAYSSSTCG